METIVRFDMRAAAIGAALPDLYAAALEMATYADEQGADVIMLTEHHGSTDGYLPAPTVLAGGFAGRTGRSRIRIASVVLPLHDPVGPRSSPPPDTFPASSPCSDADCASGPA